MGLHPNVYHMNLHELLARNIQHFYALTFSCRYFFAELELPYCKREKGLYVHFLSFLNLNYDVFCFLC